jgi:Cu/Ag efflux pump CusA
LAEVNAIGGYEKQIVIAPNPAKLSEAGVSFAQLVEVIRNSTDNAAVVSWKWAEKPSSCVPTRARKQPKI